MKLYLDDNRKTPEGWQRVNTAAECIERLQRVDITELSLDHDLEFAHYDGDYSDGKTGFAVLSWLKYAVENEDFVPPKHINIHSMNPQGGDRMVWLAKKIPGVKVVSRNVRY